MAEARGCAERGKTKSKEEKDWREEGRRGEGEKGGLRLASTVRRPRSALEVRGA